VREAQVREAAAVLAAAASETARAKELLADRDAAVARWEASYVEVLSPPSLSPPSSPLNRHFLSHDD